MQTWPLVIEGLIPKTQLDDLAAVFDEGIRAGLDDGRKTYHLHKLLELGRGDIVSAAVSAFTRNTPHQLARKLVGGDYALLLSSCIYRSHEPGRRDTHLGLHFDANVLGSDSLVVNFWMPFDPIGDGVPGLTFINSAEDVSALVEVWRRSRQEPDADGSISPKIRFSAEDVAEALGKSADQLLFTPKIRPGGAAIFHQFVIHGTELVEQDEKPRRNFEMRFSAADKIPAVCKERDDPVILVREETGGVSVLEPVPASQL